ncbi:MAG: peptide chain release factor 3 [Gemmatimonadota bacterium]
MSDTSSGTAASRSAGAITPRQEKIARRRTFAIISHPDAGKTTLTEKLLLYGGALHLAGSVKARRAVRHATSDWIEMEKERGISVTSSVLQFDYEGYRINLLDTPGHADFSEDTYRTLIAADSAVMLLDNRKGIEERTRKLFHVCERRDIPIFTFVNKCDRVGTDPLSLLDDVERDLGMTCYPLAWPVFDGPRFLGVAEPGDKVVHLFEKGEHHGQEKVGERVVHLDDPEARERLGEDVADGLREDLELLDLAGADWDEEAFEAGDLSPTFFGSALTNFGVELFLRRFLGMAPPPRPRPSNRGPVRPSDESFSGFVFKIQANMDPNHRDRVAFIRICSGSFEPGMEVLNHRSGETVRLAQPRKFLARERATVKDAWPGDVIGILDRGSLHIGDTLAEDPELDFGGIPRFSPEHFARIRVPDPLRRKHLDKGLGQLSEEGAAQVFYETSVTGPSPIVGAVGVLQFDVLLHRLDTEYNVEARLDQMPYSHARWVQGDDDEIERVASGYGRKLVFDGRSRPLLLFENAYTLRRTTEKETGLTYHEVAP